MDIEFVLVIVLAMASDIEEGRMYAAASPNSVILCSYFEPLLANFIMILSGLSPRELSTCGGGQKHSRCMYVCIFPIVIMENAS